MFFWWICGGESGLPIIFLRHLSSLIGLSILFIFSKNQLLALLIFAMVSFVSFSFFSCPNLYDFFASTNTGVLLFLVALDVELGYLFNFPLVSWDKLILLWTFPFALFLLSPIGFGLLCFHFHLFLCIFWFLFWFLLWFVGYSEVCCLASICLYF